ncbi:transposase [Streptomyces sp. NPDC054770]
MPVAGAGLSKRLVPGELWKPAAPLLPSSAARPRGGGTAPCDERAVFTAVVFALTSGCAWRQLPPTSGTSPATAHRRFTVWAVLGARCVVADPELAEQPGVPVLSRRDRTTRRPERSAHARPSPESAETGTHPRGAQQILRLLGVHGAHGSDHYECELFSPRGWTACRRRLGGEGRRRQAASAHRVVAKSWVQ